MGTICIYTYIYTCIYIYILAQPPILAQVTWFAILAQVTWFAILAQVDCP